MLDSVVVPEDAVPGECLRPMRRNLLAAYDPNYFQAVRLPIRSKRCSAACRKVLARDYAVLGIVVDSFTSMLLR